MFKKYTGVAVIRLYDANGKKIAEFAKVDFKPTVSWWFFGFLFVAGLVILGHTI